MPAGNASPAVHQLLHYRPVVSQGVNGADINETKHTLEEPAFILADRALYFALLLEMFWQTLRFLVIFKLCREVGSGLLPKQMDLCFEKSLLAVFGMTITVLSAVPELHDTGVLYKALFLCTYKLLKLCL